MYLARNEKIENGKIRHPISKKYTKIRKSENPGSLVGHLSLRYGSVTRHPSLLHGKIWNKRMHQNLTRKGKEMEKYRWIKKLPSET